MDEDAALGGLLQEAGNRFLQAGEFGAKRVHLANGRKGVIDESEEVYNPLISFKRPFNHLKNCSSVSRGAPIP